MRSRICPCMSFFHVLTCSQRTTTNVGPRSITRYLLRQNPRKAIPRSRRGNNTAAVTSEPAPIASSIRYLCSQRKVGPPSRSLPWKLILLRYAPHFGGYNAAVRIGSEYARRARLELEIDEPSIEALQTLMLLSQASFQLGKGKKTFMLLSTIHDIFGDVQTANTGFRRRHKHGICS